MANDNNSKVGPVPDGQDNSGITRKDFPKGFIFGTGTSAFQVEGGSREGGKGLSIWDDFCANYPDIIVDKSNGNFACDMYTKYKEDIRMMKRMGFDSYRFSIAWTRVLPRGRCSGGVNREGIDYYNDIINTIIEYDMIPFVTLFHWDLPLELEMEYGGFLDKKIKDDFLEFAELCFWEYGDRVKHWTTINEPLTYAVNGYVSGVFPPGHKLPRQSTALMRRLPLHRSITLAVDPENDGQDNSPKAEPWEAYAVSRNLLLAHAETVKLYKTKFKEFQQGQIGIVLDVNWFVPFTENSQADIDACSRGVDFMLGWYLDPILTGKYPDNMINNVPKESLDKAELTEDMEKMFAEYPIDFLGINYYTAQYGENDDETNQKGGGYDVDKRVKIEYEKDDVPIGEPSGSSWLYVTPWGIYRLLEYIFDSYGDKLKAPIYITENGYSTNTGYGTKKDDPNWKPTPKPMEVCHNDSERTKYHQDHLANILKLTKDKKVEDRVKGYFAWSWCDNFEWTAGYTERFGIVYTDYGVNDLTRYPKDSCSWFAKLMKKDPENVPALPISQAKKRSQDPENVPAKPTILAKKRFLTAGVHGDGENNEEARKRQKWGKWS